MGHNRLPSIALTGLGFRWIDNREPCRDEVCDTFELVVADTGHTVAFSGQYSAELKPGQAILHAPGVPHALVTGRPDKAGLLLIRFQTDAPGSLSALCGKVLPAHPDTALCLTLLIAGIRETFPFIGPCADTMPAPVKRPPFGWEQSLNGWLCQWLILQFRHQQKYKSKQSLLVPLSQVLPADTFGQEVVRYIEEHPYDVITMQSLTERFHSGRTRLQTAVRKAAGVTPMALVREVRLHTAEQLLVTTDRAVSEIADALHFGSVFAFSGAFKTRFGISPTGYRHRFFRQAHKPFDKCP